MLTVLTSNVLFVQFVVIMLLVIIDVVVTVAKALGTGKFGRGKLLCFCGTEMGVAQCEAASTMQRKGDP